MEKKGVDKRELIKEIMAIASKPDTDFKGGESEKEDTIAKKLEAIAYNPSETGVNDEENELEIKEGVKKPEETEVEIKKDDVLDEDLPKEETIVEEKVEDADVDKRELIDEIGGILKDKIDEELWRTVIGKIEKLAYNNSEAGANDCNKTVDDCKQAMDSAISMDKAIKYIAERDDLVNRVKKVIGDNVNYKKMTINEVVKYACDKLDIKNSLDCLNGYLKAKTPVKAVVCDNLDVNYRNSNVLNDYLK